MPLIPIELVEVAEDHTYEYLMEGYVCIDSDPKKSILVYIKSKLYFWHIYSFRGQFGIILALILTIVFIGYKLRKVCNRIDTKDNNEFVQRQVDLLNVKKNKPASAPLLPL